MRIEQVNVGKQTPLRVGSRKTTTGIFKEPLAGPVPATYLGLQGDAVCDSRHHGGRDQAVYLYSQEDYDFWSEELGQAVLPGTFGENLTVSGIDLAALCIGDVLQGERLVLQVTAPRIPCNTLAARMGDKTFVKRFMGVARSGAYCRVIKEGEAGAGDQFERIAYAGHQIPLSRLFHDTHGKLDQATLEEYLAVPMDERTRRDFTGKLKKLKAS